MSRAACKTELYQRRRSTGLCVQCGADAGGKSKCTSCAETDKVARQRRSEKRKITGVCTSCSQPAKEGRALCQTCIDKRSKVSMERYHRNRAAGVCPYCGGEINGEFMCAKCRTTHQKGSLDWYHRQVTSGCCTRCGDPHTGTGRYCPDCSEKAKREVKRWSDQVRDETFQAYGGAVCVRCGNIDPDVLQIDHIDGGGTQHRKKIGEPLTRWLRKQGFPPGYQVLCANCNTKKGREERQMALPVEP